MPGDLTNVNQKLTINCVTEPNDKATALRAVKSYWVRKGRAVHIKD